MAKSTKAPATEEAASGAGAHIVKYKQGDEDIIATFHSEADTHVLRNHLRRSNTAHEYTAPEATAEE